MSKRTLWVVVLGLVIVVAVVIRPSWFQQRQPLSSASKSPSPQVVPSLSPPPTTVVPQATPLAASALPRATTAPLPQQTAPTQATASIKQIAPEEQPVPPDTFADAERVLTKDYPPDADGQVKRVTILRTAMKYPLIRVEETLVREGHAGQQRVIDRKEMVADHVLVKLQPGLGENDLAALAQKY